MVAASHTAQGRDVYVCAGQMHELLVMDKEKEHMSRLKDATEMKVREFRVQPITQLEPELRVPVMCSLENSGGTDGEPQRGSLQTVESPAR